MARSQDSDDTFSFAEKALAGGFSKSAFQHLNDNGYLPKGPDIRVLARCATIGAFMSSGVPLLGAARIAHALSAEFEASGGEAPSGLRLLAEHELTPEDAATLPASPNDYSYHALCIRRETADVRSILEKTHGGRASLNGVPVTAADYDYWKHRKAVRQQGERLEKRQAFPFDARVRIIDRRHVFLFPTSRLKELDDYKKKHSMVSETPGFVGWIDEWERGADLRFRHAMDKIDPDHQYSRGNAARLQAMAEQEVLNTAIGTLTVNLSLAIRCAFDRVAEQRAEGPVVNGKMTGGSAKSRPVKAKSTKRKKSR